MIATLMLALSLAGPARADDRISLPLLPVHVRLDADRASPFCSSTELKSALAGWAFGTVFKAGEFSPATDLVVTCASHDAERALITVTDRGGGHVESFKTKVTDSQGFFENIGYLVARRLAKGRKTIEAALVAHRANLRGSAAQRGAQALAAADWAGAAESLYPALESDADPAPLYYGLYLAHARLGNVLHGRWYLLAYCEAAGKRPDQLTGEQLRPLREMTRAPRTDDGFAAASMSRYRKLTAEKRGAEAIHLMKQVLEKAPWVVEGYEALADGYGKLDWGPLEDTWRRRAKIARNASKNKRNHDSLLQIADPD